MTESQSYPKITISLSAELLERINEYREFMKISEICREALMARVDSLSRNRDKIKEDIDCHIERLRKEKQAVDKEDYDLGFNIGYEEASRASYRDLMAAYHKYQSCDECFEEFAEGSGFLNFLHAWQTWPEQAKASNWIEYIKGWNDGLAKFWYDIKHKI